MTDKFESLDDITQYLDESGNLVDGPETWTDSQKLKYIRTSLMSLLGGFDIHLSHLRKELEKHNQVDSKPHDMDYAYKAGMESEILNIQEELRRLLCVCGKNNNQKEE